MTPDSPIAQPAQPPDPPDWPESAVEPLYRPLIIPGPETEDLDPAEIPHRWRAVGNQFHPPSEVVGRLVHHALQRWLFPGNPALPGVLGAAALEAGLGDPAQRAEALRLAEILLVRLQGHPIWQEIDRAEERYHEVPYTYLGANRRLDTGYLDLIYRSVDGWNILDFKTDSLRSTVERESALEMHRSQMHRYARAGLSLLRQPVRVRVCFLDDQGQVSLIEMA